jgi:hypothetical protein
MEHGADSVRLVSDAIENLYKVLNTRDMHLNGGLRWNDPIEFRRAWKQLDESLRASAGVMKTPRPGQGIWALWLSDVFQHAANVEEAARKATSGLSDWKLLDHESLFLLVSNGRLTLFQIVKFRSRQNHGLGALLQSDCRQLDRLRQLAKEWASDSRAHRGSRRQTVREYLRTAGELVLRAVDDVEVAPQWFEEPDFRKRVLENLDTPCDILRPYLREVSGKCLLGFADRLEPKVTQPAPNTPDGPPKGYSKPNLYGRDQWIYENIGRDDYQSLSAKFKEAARRPKWEMISSRNGFKNSADRYAGFHRLPRGRFGDDAESE